MAKVTAYNEVTTVAGTDILYIVAGGVSKKVQLANLVDNIMPVGTIICYGGSSTPDGYLPTDGASVSRTTYADLYAVLGTTWGSVDGSSFNVPDIRSRFILGAGTTPTLDLVIDNINTTSDVVTLTSASGSDNIVTGQAVKYTTTGSAATPAVNNTTYYAVKTGTNTYKLATSLANALANTTINFSAAGSGTQKLIITLSTRALADKGGEESHGLVTAEIPAHTHSLPGILTTTGGGSATYGHTINNVSYTSGSTGGSTLHNNMPPYVVANYFIKY